MALPRNSGEAQQPDHEEQESITIPMNSFQQILAMVPTRDLLVVNRTWEGMAGIISSPAFNLRRCMSRRQNRFLLWGKQIHPTHLTLMTLRNRRFEIGRQVYKNDAGLLTRVLSSINGILLLKCLHGDYRHFLIVNPTVRSTTGILTWTKENDRAINYGQYYESGTDDYRVVIVSRSLGWRNEYTTFSFKKGKWSEPKSIPLVSGIKFEKGVFVDSGFYWCVQHKQTRNRNLVCFDVKEGEFNELEGPVELNNEDEGEDEICIELAVVTGRLCLYQRSKEWTRLRVWIMERHAVTGIVTWLELMNCTQDGHVLRHPSVKEEDSVVFLTDGTVRHSRFFVFCLQQHRFKEIVCDVSRDIYHHMISFSESFFSPNLHYS